MGSGICGDIGLAKTMLTRGAESVTIPKPNSMARTVKAATQKSGTFATVDLKSPKRMLNGNLHFIAFS